MKIAVVEDEKKWADRIQEIILDEYGENVDYYADAEEFLAADERYEIVFMDIELPNMDGLTAAKKYRQLYQECVLMLVTSHQEHCAAGYKVGAFRFVDKGNLKQDMKEALLSAKRQVMLFQNGEERLTFHIVGENIQTLKVCDIEYIQTEQRIVKIVTADKEYLAAETITSLYERLYEKGFYSPHKSFLVHMNKIRRIKRKESGLRDKCIELKSGKMIPLSRKKEEELKERLWQWQNERANE